VGADLDVMRRDAAARRGTRETVCISLVARDGVAPVATWVRDRRAAAVTAT
jgi:urease accessory protein